MAISSATGGKIKFAGRDTGVTFRNFSMTLDTVTGCFEVISELVRDGDINDHHVVWRNFDSHRGDRVAVFCTECAEGVCVDRGNHDAIRYLHGHFLDSGCDGEEEFEYENVTKRPTLYSTYGLNHSLPELSPEDLYS